MTVSTYLCPVCLEIPCECPEPGAVEEPAVEAVEPAVEVRAYTGGDGYDWLYEPGAGGNNLYLVVTKKETADMAHGEFVLRAPKENMYIERLWLTIGGLSVELPEVEVPITLMGHDTLHLNLPDPPSSYNKAARILS